MLAQNPWVRRGLYVLVTALVLFAVGAAAYNLGAASAGDHLRAGLIDRERGDAPFLGNRGSQAGPPAGPGDPDERGPALGRGPAIIAHMAASRPGGNVPVLRAVLGIAVLGLLAMGAVAFFRTGGWQPTAAAQSEPPAKKSAKKS